MTRKLGPDAIEERMFSAPKKRNFKNPAIAVLSQHMNDLISSPAFDAPILSVVGDKYPHLKDIGWREWLLRRQRDLPWIEREVALDGRQIDVPKSGAMLLADDRSEASKRQRRYREAGGQRYGQGPAALFALILDVTYLLTKQLPRPMQDMPWPKNSPGGSEE